MLFGRPRGATAEFALDLDDGQPRLTCLGDKGWYARNWLTRAEAIGAAKLLLDAAEAMPATEHQAGTLYCSFCGKSQHDVSKMIAGPEPVSICSECTALCCEIVGENGGPK